MYRTPRGQEAFNASMAALSASDGASPPASLFKGCARLECPLRLPAMAAGGWLPAGRLWVSPSEYVLIVQSPRQRSGRYQRHPFKRMKYFVFHEFINSSRNVDPYDTLSSHDDEVFVSFYMSKTRIDARGRRFVVVVQVAPYDVVSVHATNLDSLGPGIEVAKNVGEELEPLQGLAGIVVAEMVKSAAPHLEVVNHRGEEGLALLQAFDGRRQRLKQRQAATAVSLPFIATAAPRLAAAVEPLEALVRVPGASLPLPVAARRFVPLRTAAAGDMPVLLAPPRLVRASGTASPQASPR